MNKASLWPKPMQSFKLLLLGTMSLRATSPVQHLIRMPSQQSLLISPSLKFMLGMTIFGAAGVGLSDMWPVAMCL